MRKRNGDQGSGLSHRVHTRITKSKYDDLCALLNQSRNIHSLSELLRNILDNRKIITATYDSSLDKVMGELSAIRKELQAMGININQVTHHFHIEDNVEGKLSRAMEIAKLYQQTDLKVAQLFELISKISTKWLPE